MGKILLLDKRGFPEKFEKIDCDPDGGLTKKEYIEKEIINSINTYNYKMDITKIEYKNINDSFSRVSTGKFMGLIVENNKKEKNDDIWNGRKIVSYVFMSPTSNQGRNTFCSQKIFPEIIDLMSFYLSSPTFKLLNHPIQFINISGEKLSSNKILIQFAYLVLMGIEYIEVFNESFNPKDVPPDIKKFFETYEPQFEEKEGSIFSSDYYNIDFSSKKLKIKTDKLEVGDHLEKHGDKFSFKGSYEKFYWIVILPTIILAYENGYDIDYSNLKDFYDSYRDKFGGSEKIERFNVLLSYIKKLLSKAR